MTHNEVIYLISGLCGIILHELSKLASLKQKANAINMKFVLSKYLSDEWISMITSLVSVLMLVMFIPDILNVSQSFAKVLRILCGFVGYTGSAAIQWVFSLLGVGTNSKILEITKQKINEKDNSTTDTDSIQLHDNQGQ